MRTDRLKYSISYHPVFRVALWFIAGALMFLALIQNLPLTIGWWRHGLPEPQPTDWLWVLPLLFFIGIYLRYFSIFRPDCRACLPEEQPTQDGPRGP
jgi:hypothetical protein